MDARDFERGDRIRLVSMDDPYREAPIEMLGTVLGVCPPPINVLDVDWDGDFNLNPCLDVDIVKKVGNVRNDREFYSVFTDDDGRKIIKYQGFTWCRPCSDDGLDYACTEVCWCFVDVGNVGPEEDIRDVIAFCAEGCTQYQEDMDERSFYKVNATFFNGTSGIELDVREVDDNTPDGNYYYEVVE